MALPDDKDFDPSAEALINDIDDERTLEEEEANADNNQAKVQEELDDLKKESEMPIEELLAYYERLRQQSGEGPEGEEEEEDIEEYEADDDEDDDDEDEEEDEEEVQKPKNTTPVNKKPDDNDDGEGRGGPADGGPRSASSGGTKRPASDLPPSKKSIDEQGRPQTKNDQSSNSANCSGDALATNQTIPATTCLDDKSPQIDSNNIRTNNLNELNDNLDQIRSSSFDGHTNMNTELPEHAQSHVNESLTCYLLQQNPSSAYQKLLGYDLDDSDDDDYSYTSDDMSHDERDWRRVINIGPDYQAEVPEGLSEYDNLPPYQTKDTLIWKSDPHLITEENLINYLKSSSLIPRKDLSISPASVPRITPDSMRQWKAQMCVNVQQHNLSNTTNFQPNDNLPDVYMTKSGKRTQIELEIERENANEESITDSVNEGTTSDSTSQDNNNKPEIPTEDYFQDEEQLLYLLLQCNYDTEEAIRRRTLDPFKYYFHEPMSLWSENECLAFENGLRAYGKDFRSIRENKVPTRTHAELVAFYYLWKKSERHDVYTNRYKLDRKRSLTHPGIADYMDNFIDDSVKLNSSTSPTSSPPILDNSIDMNVNVDLCNDSGLATPSCILSDSRSPQPNSTTPNNSHGSTASNIQKSLLQIHQVGIGDNEKSSHRETVYLDSNI